LYEIHTFPWKSSAIKMFRGKSLATLGAASISWRATLRIVEDQQTSNNFAFEVPITEVSDEQVRVAEEKVHIALSTKWPISNTTFALL
jgi:hypothetical protein